MRILVFLLLSSLLACSEKSTAPASDPSAASVALQIDATEQDPASLLRICAELAQRDLPATLFVNPDLGQFHEETVHELYLSGFEIALLTPYLGNMPRQMQATHLHWGLVQVSGCPLCKTDHPVVGMRPGGFAQDETTCQLADSIGFAYDAGFQARLLYAPGHELDDRPYRLEGYALFAVPATTLLWEEERICLSDQTCKNLEVPPEQWGELMVAAFDRAAETGTPLVPVVHDWILGKQDSPYWPPFLRFLDHAGQRRARFITTERLVIEHATR